MRQIKVLDWKNEAQSSTKPPGLWHFQFNKAKRFIFTGKTNGFIWGEPNYYTDTGEPKSVCKRGKKITNVKPKILPIGCSLKGDKSTIISLLKKHYGDTWMENPDLEFYFKNLISNKNQDTSNDENEVEIGCMASRPIEIDLPI